MKGIIFTVWMFFLSPFAMAGVCTSMSLQVSAASAGNVIVQRDAPIGSILYSGVTSDTGIYASGCTNPLTLRFTMTYQGGNLSSYGNHVYNTNIPGLGVRFFSGGSANQYFDNPPNIFSFIESGGIMMWYGGGVEFVKTGPIVSSGVLSAGTLAKISLLGSDSVYHDVVNFNMNQATIIGVACTITTPSLTFPIGDILSENFGSVVGTIPPGGQNSQNMGLSCDAGANINVVLQGAQNPDTGNTSVLALIGQGSPGVATGVGVQILYNGAPLALNNRVAMKQSAGGQEMLPIIARYYQTRTAVTTGSANASATINLTYQ